MVLTVDVDVVGEGTREVDLAADATYADLVRAVGYSVHEVTVLVDGRPVPEDLPVDAAVDDVRVLRLVKGGDGSRERQGRYSRRLSHHKPLTRLVEL
jgi:sulfur carrier protein